MLCFATEPILSAFDYEIVQPVEFRVLHLKPQRTVIIFFSIQFSRRNAMNISKILLNSTIKEIITSISLNHTHHEEDFLQQVDTHLKTLPSRKRFNCVSYDHLIFIIINLIQRHHYNMIRGKVVIIKKSLNFFINF